MKKSYLTVALAILVSSFLPFSIAEAQQSTKQKIKVVREGVGFDGIKVGSSTESDVIKKFGKNFKLKKHKKYSAQIIYPNGVSFYYCQADKRKQIFDIELRAPFEAKTFRGITLGKSTLEDIYRIYGKTKDGGLAYGDIGVSFYYANIKGKKIVTVIDIVEKPEIRQCDKKFPTTKNK